MLRADAPRRRELGVKKDAAGEAHRAQKIGKYIHLANDLSSGVSGKNEGALDIPFMNGRTYIRARAIATPDK
jgi:hypothetical protein